MLVLIATGAILYVPALVGLIGQHRLVERIHIDSGLALPFPLAVSLVGPWGRGLRADLRRLNRWSWDDRLWLRTLLRYPLRAKGVPVGKFNAGQKLNAAFVAGVMLVMLITGSVMHWPYFWPLSWRTGATFVHDGVAIAIAIVVLGHVAMALTHPGALRSIFTGWVSRAWAARHASSWLEEIDSAGAAAAQLRASMPRGRRSRGQPSNSTAASKAKRSVIPPT
ncbi:MAG TPA: cytochrome b/b6 domain-containing protein, partial [Acidimicrobiales bacterium]|nr:cytochrome b/b6 domain-containing protein [Acidimicrobiales bacterium]